MHIILRLIMFMGACSMVTAQDGGVPLKSPMNFEGLSVGITPSALTNFYPGPQISLDYGFKGNRRVLANEVGLLFSPGDEGLIGYRARTGLVHVWPWQRASLLLGAHGSVRYISFDHTFPATRAGGEFVEFLDFKEREWLIGLSMQMEVAIKLSERMKASFGFGSGPAVVYTINNFSLPFFGFFNPNAPRFPSFRNGVQPWILTYLHVNFSYQFSGPKKLDTRRKRK